MIVMNRSLLKIKDWNLFHLMEQKMHQQQGTQPTREVQTEAINQIEKMFIDLIIMGVTLVRKKSLNFSF